MDKFEQHELLQRMLSADADRPVPAKETQEAVVLCCDHWAAPVLLERTAYLRKLARFGEGSASEILKEYSGYSALLSVYLRSGAAVSYDDSANTILVLEGRATLMTGGEIERPTHPQPGETRGWSISGGTQREVRAGDVVHVPARTQHQFLLAGEKPLSFLTWRIRETLQS